MWNGRCWLLFQTAQLTITNSVEALGTALGSWGGDGAIVIVSHDERFCSLIDFTHVAIVNDGTFRMEERSAQPKDWVVTSLSASNVGSADVSPESLQPSSQPKLDDPKLRKQMYNAPKRIAKLEELIGKVEQQISVIDEDMLSNGKDVGLLVDLTKEKAVLQSKVEEYLEEWESLETMLAGQV